MCWFLKTKRWGTTILANDLFRFFLTLFIILIPWQMRWIFYDYNLMGEVWEYGRLSLYGSMIILFLAGLFFIFGHRQELRFSKDKFLYFIFIYSLVVGFFSLAPAVYFYYLALVYLAVLFAHLLKFLPKYFVFKAFLASGLIQALVALWQFLAQETWASKWFGLALHLPATPGTSVVVVNGQRILRAYGSLPHPNVLGGFLFVAIFLGLYLWIDFYNRSREHHYATSFIKKNLSEFIFVIASLVICTYGLLASFSRSALGALILSLFSALLISIFKRNWLRVSIITKYLLIFILAFWSFNAWLPGAWTVRWQAEGPLEQKSLEERVTTAEQLGFNSYKNIFLGQGFGLNTFDNYWRNPNQPVYSVQPIHNIFLLALAELGMVGFVLLLLVLRAVFRAATKVDLMATSLILGLIIIGFLDHYLWTSWTGWLLMTLSLTNLTRNK